MNKFPQIYFYCPQYDKFRKDMPESAETSWQWQVYKGRYEYEVLDSDYAWILQTYLRLKEANFPCELTTTLPSDGIIVANRESLNFDIKPGSKQLLVVAQGDKCPHPYAQLSIIQNPKADCIEFGLIDIYGQIHFPQPIKTHLKPLNHLYYIPLWPQPGLQSRDQSRGDRFENIGFFGVGTFLAPELRSPQWKNELESLGIRWSFKGRDQISDGWTNYTDVDLVLAVRSFNTSDNYVWKPATKLYNAWHANVPVILAPESAYQAERKSDLDYIEVHSLSELIQAIKRLRDHPELRQAMIDNGRMRATETTPEKLVAKWQNFFVDKAVPAYENWCNMTDWQKSIFLMRRQLAVMQSNFNFYLHLKKGNTERRLKALTRRN